jgi:hypothetical protein
MSTNAPATYDHNAFLSSSAIRTGISEARAAAVMDTMANNGPSTRANMRGLTCDSGEALTLVPPSAAKGYDLATITGMRTD